MQYKAVIFDLDGTLIDSLADLADSANLMLESYGYPTHTLKAYRYFVGNGSRKLIERCLPAKMTDAFIEEALMKYKKIYAHRILEKTRSYQGILELLKTLHHQGIPMGICTNKHQEAANTLVNVLFEPGTFTDIVGDLPGRKRKPDPENVLVIARNMGVKPSEVAYLGDSGVDMQTAVHAGFLPIGVLWGFRDAEELTENGAALLLKTPQELLQKVKFASLLEK